LAGDIPATSGAKHKASFPAKGIPSACNSVHTNTTRFNPDFKMNTLPFRRLLASLFLCALAVSACFATDVLPTDRPASWEAGVYSGIIGGIPSASWTDIYDVTDYGADPTGVASSQSAFDAARLAAATAGGSGAVIYFPSGTYLLATMTGSTNQVVRGAGMFLTTINFTGGPGYTAGQGVSWNLPYTNVQANVTSGFTHGSTQVDITLDGTNANAPVAGFPVRSIFQTTEPSLSPGTTARQICGGLTPFRLRSAR